MRIAIANTPRPAVDTLRQALSRAPQHSIAWTANHCEDVLRLCKEDLPDLLLMGLLLPVTDAVECTSRVTRFSPCPVLVVSVDYERQISGVFEVMGAGALDVVNVPAPGSEESVRELLRKIEAIGKRVAAKSKQKSLPAAAAKELRQPPPLVVIGASTGGPNAVSTILSALPKDFPAAVLIVQHVDEQFADGIARWFSQHCRLAVSAARSGDRPEAGRVLLASTNDHMILTADRALAYTPEPADYPYRPSVDVFFESVAQHWPQPSVAVLLTGMGRDGASGLKSLLQAGWLTIAQDRESCAVFGMPKAAIELGAAKRVLPLAQIAEELVAFVKSTTRLPARG